MKLTKVASKIEYKLKKKADLDSLHNALDVIGLIPGIGEIADLTNAVLYATKGDWLLATISVISMIPEIGDALGKGTKAALWLEKQSPEALKEFKKHYPKIKQSILLTKKIFKENESKIKDFIDDVIEGKKLKSLSEENKDFKEKAKRIKNKVDDVFNILEKSERLAEKLN